MAGFLGLNADDLQLFLDETAEHLDVLELDLLAVEREGADPDRVGRIFRAAHTIKGAAAAVGLEGLAHLTHTMETLLDRMRAGDVTAGPEVISPLLGAVDVLREMLTALVDRRLPPAPPPAVLAALAAAGGAGHRDHVPAAPGATAPVPGPVPAPVTGGGSGHITVVVRLRPGCPMPAVRALQVLLALEGTGDVLGSDPSQADIEEERVGESLTIWLDTDRPPAAVETALAQVPDLLSVAVMPPGGPNSASPPPGAGDSGRLAATPPRGGEDRTIRVDVSLLDTLMNLVGELVIDRGRLAGIGQRLGHRRGTQDVAEELTRVTGHLARITGTLQETVLKARMLPIERVFKKFPRMVRDLAQQLGKRVELRIAGEETELDRSLLEVIGDPLMHLVRNALDHGAEEVAERRRAGKPETVTLSLVAAHEENHVVIRVQDDGRGIDAERVRAAAVARGLLTADRARELGEHDTIQFLFAPGFSTAERVTDLSGRGVGLDVVRRNIEQVGGRIEVESQVGAGTTFRLMLPLTLATIQGLLVEADNEVLTLPISVVVETLQVLPQDVSSVKGRWVTRVRERVVPLLWLHQFLSPGMRPDRPARPLLAVLVSHKGEAVGLVVDRLVGEQEVVVKGLGAFLGQVQGVSGVTILGDGKPALILDVGGLIGALSAGRAVASPDMGTARAG